MMGPEKQKEYADFIPSDDLTRNWHAKIAVKITAVTLWPTIVMSFLLAFILLYDIEEEIELEQKNMTSIVAYEVTRLWPQDDSLNFYEKLEQLRLAYNDSELPGFELTYQGTIHKVGDLQILENHTDTTLNAIPDDDIKIRTFFPDPRQEASSIRNQVLLMIFVAMLMFAIFMTAATRIILDKPLRNLVDVSQKISQGNLNIRVDTSRQDEFGTIARFFNKMLDSLTQKKHLEEAARTDFLTGIANRRHFDETLSRELRRSTRSGSPLTLIMCDVDYFKQYNDLYNHVAGDLCLKHIANTLNKVFNRAGDHVARYGGEEFVVILPDTDRTTGLMMAKNLRAELAALKLPHEKSLVSDYVTLSIGVATVQSSDMPGSESELLQTVDEALYRAKEKGRNRIEADLIE